MQPIDLLRGSFYIIVQVLFALECLFGRQVMLLRTFEGRLRLRLDGSSGGHNGLDSIFMHLGTDAIPRLRIGVGSPPQGAAVDYVLGRFFEEERPVMEEAVARAVAALKCTIDKGVVSAMNTFNKNPET